MSRKINLIRYLRTSSSWCFIIYLFIGTLFVYKYGSRQNYVNPILLTSAFITIYTAFIFYFTKKDLSPSFYKYAYIGLAIFYLIVTIFINIKVDKYALMPDRWSAMEAGIRALFSGEYPYSALDHRNGRTSNLPTLLFIGIPFYLMGDVGYLQTFSSAIFFLLIGYALKNYKQKFFATFLFTASISFMWEVWVKSDIMSNFILLLLYINITPLKYDKGDKPKIIVTAILSTQLLLTRLVAIIPLNILLLKKFLYLKLREKIVFILISILIIAINFWIVFKNVSSINEFKIHNPFLLQNSQLPLYLSVVCVALSIYFSFHTKSLATVLIFSSVSLFVPSLLAMITQILRYGFYNAYFNSRIDVSYFDMCMPFLIFYWSTKINYKTASKY